MGTSTGKEGTPTTKSANAPVVAVWRIELEWYSRFCSAILEATALTIPGPGALLETSLPKLGLMALLEGTPECPSWMDRLSKAIGAVHAVIEDPRTPEWASHVRQLSSDLVNLFDGQYNSMRALAQLSPRSVGSSHAQHAWKNLKAICEALGADIARLRDVAVGLEPLVVRLRRQTDFESEVLAIGAADVLANGKLRLTGGRKQRDSVRVWLDRDGSEVYLGRLRPSHADELVTLIEKSRDAAARRVKDFRGVPLYNKKIKAVKVALPLLAPFVVRVLGSTANAKAHYLAEPPLRLQVVDARS
ncbi:MAG: hypothetical protein DPW14_04565 [Planctomycetes bacterium]|nr:hypothetical protein [Planctomycetota bacterium]